ncbi:hypothetical protein [Hymenobacter volaticus]|uniref:Uncharacterized protein n=1 Tax=Hymenobacter volaticus TaxID=2932254 RepID=A0ABY4G6F5_9BACT|nr:hypothetical protein [Hymenobacter volaticus]UOQ66490.1 hypothetical protein MUN86_00715 [Hymenobacter volaticus]
MMPNSSEFISVENAGLVAGFNEAVAARALPRGQLKKLESFGLEQHVNQVAKHGQRQDKEGNHHEEEPELDVVEKLDGFKEEPEASAAGGGKQGNHKSRCHKCQIVDVRIPTCQSRPDLRPPLLFIIYHADYQ